MVPAAAEKVRDWIARNVTHTIGHHAGKPFLLADWQWRDIVLPLFGWVHQDTGLRRYRECDLWVARGNGKSTLAAALMMYMLFSEPGAQVLATAYDRDQANAVHGEAIRFATESPNLAAVLRINKTTQAIHLDATHSIFKVVTNDGKRGQGGNTLAASSDEIHVWDKSDFWGVVRRGGLKRKQPLFFNTSTAGIYDPESFGWERYETGKFILRGESINIRRLVVIYEADEADDLDDPETWKKANPGWGELIDPEEMAEDYADSLDKNYKLAEFKRYRCNLWVDVAHRWLKMELWRAAATDQGPPWDEVLSFGGLDVASIDDYAAFCRICEWEGRYHAQWHYWASERGAERRRREDELTMSEWSEYGLVTLFPGNAIDLTVVQRDIIAMHDAVPMVEVGYDPSDATFMAMTLLNEYGIEMVKIPPGAVYFNEPARFLESLLADGGFAHDGNPIATWNAGNAILRTDAWDRILPVKAAARKKIDGLMCVLMALRQLMVYTDIMPRIHVDD